MNMQVSKNLRSSLSERAVWREALLDILEIVPLPQLTLTVPDMAASALRKHAIRMAKTEQGFNRNPTIIQSLKIETMFGWVQLLPGGKYFIATNFICTTTTITLHQVDQPHSSVTLITGRNIHESVFFQTNAHEIVVAAKSRPQKYVFTPMRCGYQR